MNPTRLVLVALALTVGGVVAVVLGYGAAVEAAARDVPDGGSA